MLKFIVQSNINNTEVEFETNDLKILLKLLEEQKHNCSNDESKAYDALYNKIKALCLFDKLPDKQSISQIKDILLSSSNVTKDNIHNLKIENLQLSKRAFHGLDRAGIKTIEDLLCLSKNDLLRIRNLGINSINEIVDTLKKYDLELLNFSSK